MADVPAKLEETGGNLVNGSPMWITEYELYNSNVKISPVRSIGPNKSTHDQLGYKFTGGSLGLSSSTICWLYQLDPYKPDIIYSMIWCHVVTLYADIRSRFKCPTRLSDPPCPESYVLRSWFCAARPAVGGVQNGSPNSSRSGLGFPHDLFQNPPYGYSDIAHVGNCRNKRRPQFAWHG